jgi:hypothetical protein
MFIKKNNNNNYSTSYTYINMFMVNKIKLYLIKKFFVKNANNCNKRSGGGELREVYIVVDVVIF